MPKNRTLEIVVNAHKKTLSIGTKVLELNSCLNSVALFNRCCIPSELGSVNLKYIPVPRQMKTKAENLVTREMNRINKLIGQYPSGKAGISIMCSVFYLGRSDIYIPQVSIGYERDKVNFRFVG